MVSEQQPGEDMLAHDWTHVLDFARPLQVKSAPEVELMALALGIVYMMALLLRKKMGAPLVTLSECADLQTCTNLTEAMERHVLSAEPSS